jgi:CheY-like chemotaxis protein
MNYILLADDDEDDRLIFEEALIDLSLNVTFKSVDNGLKVMQLLNNEKEILPHILFLDLNMPLQTGHECLKEIRSIPRLQKLTVIIYSTSLNQETVELLYEDGADYYICKPGDYGALKRTIQRALSLVEKNESKKISKSEFIINS